VQLVHVQDTPHSAAADMIPLYTCQHNLFAHTDVVTHPAFKRGSMLQILQSIAASATMHVQVNASGIHNQVDAGIASSWLQISNGNCTWPGTPLVARQTS